MDAWAHAVNVSTSPEETDMQINDIRPGSAEPWIAPEHCPHNEVAFAGEALSWCEACGTVLTGQAQR